MNRMGKSWATRTLVECALNRPPGYRMAIATGNQKKMLARLREWFPNDLFVVEGEWYVRIVPRSEV